MFWPNTKDRIPRHFNFWHIIKKVFLLALFAPFEDLLRILLDQIASYATSVSVVYSASVEDRAIVCCLFRTPKILLYIRASVWECMFSSSNQNGITTLGNERAVSNERSKKTRDVSKTGLLGCSVCKDRSWFYYSWCFELNSCS